MAELRPLAQLASLPPAFVSDTHGDRCWARDRRWRRNEPEGPWSDQGDLLSVVGRWQRALRRRDR